ncbi:MAG: hypothetical protein H8F28_27945 [Fibrella sp.]|nr:hypothetical protein [Armatimonadota bacterium]
MRLIDDTENTAISTGWLESTRDALAHLSLEEHDAALRMLIADWSRRHTDGERLATNPAWEAFDAFVAEDRSAEREVL